MKVAILTESEIDDAVVRVFVNALLGEEIELHPIAIRERGSSGILQSLPGLYRGLYYSTDVDRLAVVLDSDTSLPHHADHDGPDKSEQRCRLRQIRATIASIQTTLSGRDRPPIKTAIGLAMPCIEAWLLCGSPGGCGVTETNWIAGLQSNRLPYRCNELKARLHGNARPHRNRLDKMTAEARRLCANLTALENNFPNGFGPFAASVRAWSPSS
jgi:hypothetical protein